MKKTDTPVPDLSVISETVIPPTEFRMTLDEFCQRLSVNDKRVEMIAGFYHWAKARGYISGLETHFVELYTDFTTLPA